MTSKSMVLRLLAAAFLFVVALVGLDVVDSARTVVVLGGYLWFALFVVTALFVAFRAFQYRRPH